MHVGVVPRSVCVKSCCSSGKNEISMVSSANGAPYTSLGAKPQVSVWLTQRGLKARPFQGHELHPMEAWRCLRRQIVLLKVTGSPVTFKVKTTRASAPEETVPGPPQHLTATPASSRAWYGYLSGSSRDLPATYDTGEPVSLSKTKTSCSPIKVCRLGRAHARRTAHLR
jgi:hypothetical protein